MLSKPAAPHPDSGNPTTLAHPSKAATLNSLHVDENQSVRLHITPFTPALLKAYIAPSVLPLAKNISYHSVATFPEKGFGYVELPAMEAQKLKKKLNGSTLKGSKIRIEEAKPEKRKALEEQDAADDKPAKRAKKEKRKKELDVLEGAELPADRKIKRGWTEPSVKNRRDRKEQDKGYDKDKKDKKPKQKESKYTKEPELLFKTKLTPVAATDLALKDKAKGKKDKKEKNKSKAKDEVVLHEFEHNTKQPSFLKSAPVTTEAKPAVEYVNGQGWVDEDGNVVEPETGKARNRRVLELVDTAPEGSSLKTKSPTPEVIQPPISESTVTVKPKKSKATPPPSSDSESEESSVVSSSESDDSDSEAASEVESRIHSPTPAEGTPEIAITPSSPDLEKKEVHPLEALFKRPKGSPSSTPNPTSTPSKGLAPINTSFSFFDNENEPMDVDADTNGNPPVTPYTQRDLEWRGLRSAAPTPDTAAIGRRFSFSWRKGSHEADDEDDDLEAGNQLNNNTKANSSVNHLPGLAEEDEDEEETGTPEHDDEEIDINTPLASKRQTRSATKQGADGEEKDESEFAKWFWENRGENNRAWKKRRRETLKAKRLRDNKKLTVRKV